ncbi:hypothetical protein FPOAC1_007544 [Fusarium poae]|uniref:Uncharacterized protein n=1 Tax=Fusarium poae TaxID=36050 RepID=A0A1B8AR02_FUSPO|nr:hypothetical protein FPOAC1_007544 [Fusarium poae]KAG8668168.1 hypothetical protein FPOAC1_007544 [Fusarium poae]OBS22907.1 hypothetical protein FPOA_09230 [Fusarium poae]
MHFSQFIVIAATVFTQGSLAVGVKTYSGRDCTGGEVAVTVDGGQACSAGMKPFQSYRENGFGKKNGQRIAFYAESSCNQNSFIYDTYSYDGDYFHSKVCYNIDGHSPVKTARGIKLY